MVFSATACNGDTTSSIVSSDDSSVVSQIENSSDEKEEQSNTESSEAETSAPETTTTKEPETSAHETTTTKEPETSAPETTTTKEPETSAPETTTTKEPETSAPETTTTVKPEEDEPVQATGGFKVLGDKLYDANGNEFVMRGVNHAHTWFRQHLDTALEAIAKTGSNTVRIVLSDGDQWNRIPVDEVKEIIEKCKAYKMIAVVEVHDGTGKDEVSYLNNAVDYWIEVKDALIGNEAYVILNIANEWYGSWDNLDKWAEGYKQAIPKLRAAGIKNTIMVDCAGWGQLSNSFIKHGKEVFEADEQANTMFSIHMYGTAGKNKSTISRAINGAILLDLCLVVGEFGYNHSDGDVDEATILEMSVEKNKGYLGWSWKGNGGGVEYLDIAKDWEGTTLSSDWGEVLINGKNGIKETSKVCSVFE
ncbi:MAG: cellulase family glycosylhydrolase [Ruminiclostridium sp.]|nr:cellulase family glycosylhydrolase [Ruminiclostridium sp.]